VKRPSSRPLPYGFRLSVEGRVVGSAEERARGHAVGSDTVEAFRFGQLGRSRSWKASTPFTLTASPRVAHTPTTGTKSPFTPSPACHRETRRNQRLCRSPAYHRHHERRTEGFNRIINQVKRAACGFRNMNNYQRRIIAHIAVTRPRGQAA
jgi:hypothetical protein